jgi:subtilisin
MSRTPAGRFSARLATVAAAALIPVALAVPSAAAPPTGIPAATPDSVPGAWIVTLEAGASPDGVSAEHSRRFAARVDHLYRHAVRGYAARMSEQAAAKVAQDPRVASVERDRVVTVAAAQPLPTGIDRIDGELSTTIAGNGSGDVMVDVAVIDTGIDLKHTDLNVVGGKNCSTGTSYTDGNGHGTHVAGTIAAKDNTVGVVGVAPGARLWAVRVLNNQGSGTRAGIICGIDWVTGLKDAQSTQVIEVANMSLGGGGTDTGCDKGDSYHDAICRSVGAGITYVVAAGNESDDAANHVPAAYDEVITVSALADSNGAPGGSWTGRCRIDQEDTLAAFSNYGDDVDLIAPGVCINSTWKGGGYNTISGTSMASPHVAGAAALYKAGHPSASPSQVKTALQETGNTGWSDADDPDSLKETLLNVDTLEAWTPAP